MKVYKIYDNTHKKYVSLGYKSRSTWTNFPTLTIEELTRVNKNYHEILERFEVHEFELAVTNKYLINKTLIK